jgi:MFS family permease
MLTPISLSIVRNVFTDERERAQALGIWSSIFGIGTACGPIAGGILVSTLGWRSVFWLNVPVGIAMLLAARRYVPESKAPRPRRVDVPGQLLMIVLLGSLTYAIIQGPASGWASALVLGLFGVAALAAAAFVAVERRRAEPLLELRFFRSPPFTGASVIAVLAFMVLAGFLFVITLYLQEVRGFSPLRAGLSLLPMTLVMAAAVALVLLGAGQGLVNPPITSTGIAGMPPAQAGVASAVISSTRQVGNVLGVAVMGAMLTGGIRDQMTAGAKRAQALTAATHAPWLLAMTCGLAVAIVALATTSARARQTARAVSAGQPRNG